MTGNPAAKLSLEAVRFAKTSCIRSSRSSLYSKYEIRNQTYILNHFKNISRTSAAIKTLLRSSLETHVVIEVTESYITYLPFRLLLALFLALPWKTVLPPSAQKTSTYGTSFYVVEFCSSAILTRIVS